MQNAVWAITNVVMPKGSPMREKNAINTMPKMISGIIMGRVEIYSTVPFKGNFTLLMP